MTRTAKRRLRWAGMVAQIFVTVSWVTGDVNRWDIAGLSFVTGIELVWLINEFGTNG